MKRQYLQPNIPTAIRNREVDNIGHVIFVEGNVQNKIQQQRGPHIIPSLPYYFFPVDGLDYYDVEDGQTYYDIK